MVQSMHGFFFLRCRVMEERLTRNRDATSVAEVVRAFYDDDEVELNTRARQADHASLYLQ